MASYLPSSLRFLLTAIATIGNIFDFIVWLDTIESNFRAQARLRNPPQV
jgi:hypothetical protein